MLKLSDYEISNFMCMTSHTVQDYIHGLQREQEAARRLMYMKRLEPFVVAMKQFEQGVGFLTSSDNLKGAMAYVWVSSCFRVRSVSLHND